MDLTIVHLTSPSGVRISENNTATLKLGVILGVTLGLSVDKSEGYTVGAKDLYLVTVLVNLGAQA